MGVFKAPLEALKDIKRKSKLEASFLLERLYTKRSTPRKKIIRLSLKGKKSLAASGFLHKGKKAEFEQWERSNLTKEHEQPVCSRIPSSSSDSTENSNKRKRHTSSMDGGNSLGKFGFFP
ncbi:uncharacterized protein Fot_26449 [Forsythia ovata]|uniref:Uncharacterized protein n=1 Tax=Forsythia ovata TaxID=205694 RepID=A0ABD1UBX4_9LAMI